MCFTQEDILGEFVEASFLGRRKCSEVAFEEYRQAYLAGGRRRASNWLLVPANRQRKVEYMRAYNSRKDVKARRSKLPSRSGKHRRKASQETRNKIRNAKLSLHIANEVRSLFANGEYSKAELGRRYGVSRTAIRDIITGRSWA